jgi:hypothetical protein
VKDIDDLERELDDYFLDDEDINMKGKNTDN